MTQGGIELRHPDRRFEIENRQPAYARAATEPEIVEHFESVMEDWCTESERLLNDNMEGISKNESEDR